MSPGWYKSILMRHRGRRPDLRAIRTGAHQEADFRLVPIQGRLRAGGGRTASGDCLSELDAFCNRERILELDAKVSDGAVHLGVPEQQLDRPQVTGLPIDQGGLRAPHRMGPEGAWLQTDQGHPPTDHPGILKRREMRHPVEPAREETRDPFISGRAHQALIAFRVRSPTSNWTG